MKNIHSLDYNCVDSRLCSKTIKKCKTTFKELLLLLLITFSLSSFSQTRCDGELRFSVGHGHYWWDDPIMQFQADEGFEQHVINSETFNSQNPLVYWDLPSIRKCECIFSMRLFCSTQPEDLVDVEVYDNNYNYLYTFYDVSDNSYQPGGGCFEFPEDGIHYLKIKRTYLGVPMYYGWYRINVLSNTDIEDIVDISISNTEICRGQQVCVNISNINFLYTYSIRWNNTTLTSGSITPPTSSFNYCFTPQTFGTGVVTVNSSDQCNDIAVYTQQINVKAFNDFTLPATVCAESSFNVGTITWCNGVVSGASYIWNWGDGTPNSTTQSASHTYANSGTYNVTLTVSSTSGTQSMTKQIIVNPLPIEPIVTGKFNNCTLTNTYTIPSPQYGTTYTWSANNTNTTSSTGTSKTFVWWSNATFVDPPSSATMTIVSNNGCSRTTTYKIWECCNKGVIFADQTITTVPPSGDITFNGTVTLDADINLTSRIVYFGPEAKLIINSSRKLNIQQSDVKAGCNHMWDGIYPASTAEIEMGSSYVSDAYNAVVSNSGAKFTLVGTTFNKNLHGVLVNSYAGTHTGTIRSCVFSSVVINTNTPSNLIAPYTTRRGISGVKVSNVNNITIGNVLSASYVNTFKYLDFGIHVNGSNVTVYNNNFGPLPKTSGAVPENGFGIYAEKDGSTANTITVGNMNTNRYYPNTFNTCAVGIRVVNPFNLNVYKNTYNDNTYGNLITDNTNRSVTFNTNAFNRNMVGIWCNNFAGTTQDIEINTMVNNSYGIWLSNNVATPIVDVQVIGNFFSYNSTMALDNYNSIMLSNVQGYANPEGSDVFSHISGNNISFAGVPISNSTVRSGIRLENSPRCFVEQNTVLYGNTTISTTTDANKLNGINVILSPNTHLCSNVLQYLGNGVRVEGFCDNSEFILNDFRRYNFADNNYSYGFNFITATVGIQGTPSQTWDNKFNANFLITKQIRGVGSMALQQPWYFINNIDLYKFAYFGQQIPVNLATIYNMVPSASCSLNGDFMMNGISSVAEASEDNFIENVEENIYLKQYSILSNNNSIDVISESYLSNQANISKFISINKLINQKEYSSADSLNHLIVPANLIEQNFKTVNEVYLRTWALGTYNLSNEDYNTLIEIASQDPSKSGYAVVNAWVMTRRFDIAADVKHSNSSKIHLKSNILLYPNPAKDNLTINGVENASIIIINDVFGRFVTKIENQSNSNTIEFSLKGINKGVYFLNFINFEGQSLNVQKLIIN